MEVVQNSRPIIVSRPDSRFRLLSAEGYLRRQARKVYRHGLICNAIKFPNTRRSRRELKSRGVSLFAHRRFRMWGAYLRPSGAILNG